VSSEYTSGRVRRLALENMAVDVLPIEATGDTVLRSMGGAVALLHRAVGDQDNLTLFHPQTHSMCQFSLVTDEELRASRGVRPWVNPHDALAVTATKIYVTRYMMHAIAVIDVTQRAITHTIDLTPYQGLAPRPYPDALARVGNEIWATLERDESVDRMHPTQRGLVLRIDPERDRVVGTIELTHANPFGPLHRSPDGSQRWVVTMGSYNVVGDGGVDVMDVATGRVLEPLITETEVDGNIDALAVYDARRVVLRVSGQRAGTNALGNVRVVLFDLNTRGATTLATFSQWAPAAPIVLSGVIYVADPGEGNRFVGAGIRRFNGDGMALDRAPIAVDPGRLPYDLSVLPLVLAFEADKNSIGFDVGTWGNVNFGNHCGAFGLHFVFHFHSLYNHHRLPRSHSITRNHQKFHHPTWHG
jgi:hypothetical protein